MNECLLSEEFLGTLHACKSGVDFWKRGQEGTLHDALPRAIKEKRYSIAAWILLKTADDKRAFVARYRKVARNLSDEEARKFLVVEMGEGVVNG